MMLVNACSTAPTRPQVTQKMMRPVPFEARPSGDTNQFKPRVLVFRAKSDPAKSSEEWVTRAEVELFKNLERAGVYVLLRPADVGMDPKEFTERGQWDWVKIQQVARDKAIPLVMEWELAPIQVKQDADPIGIVRERRREIIVQVKTHLRDSRKGTDISLDTGEARQQDRDVLWLSRTDGQITVADYDPVTLELLLTTAIEDLVPRLVSHAQRISWSGRVAMIKGDRLYLNIGRQSGLQVGDILKVLETGDEVFDPETGDSIGKVPGRMKGTLEVISYFGQDGSVAVVHSGAGFQENDAIEYY
jgi:hypothetical protein